MRDTLYAVVSRVLQPSQPEKAVQALGIVFLLVCERFEVSPRKVLEVADRVLRDMTNNEDAVTVRAARRYLREEVKG